MKGKRIRAEFLIAISLILVVLGSVGMMLLPDREPDGILENRFGDVVWNHELHARMKSIANCTVCHHSEQQGAMDLKPCKSCHQAEPNQFAMINPELFMTIEAKKYGGEKGPPPMTALHSSCQGCHKAVKQGPVACRDCHSQTFTGPHGRVSWNHTLHSRRLDMMTGDLLKDKPLKDNCVACHHQDGEAVTEADYRACGTCHKPAIENAMSFSTGIKDHENVVHGQCQQCHVDFNPENKPTACIGCHNGIKQPLAETAISLEQAVHERCATCHKPEEDLEGMTSPGICADCHKPDPSWIQVANEGVVVWDHERHGKFGNIECETCHHTDSVDAPKIACRTCHGKEAEVPHNLKESLELTCLECHKKENIGLTTWSSITTDTIKEGYFKFENNQGAFWWDHRLHAFDVSLSCQNCHHNTIVRDGKYVTAVNAKVSWPEKAGDIQSCSNCHQDETTPGKPPLFSLNAPTEEDAFKTVCTSCHQKLDISPKTWEAYFQQ